MTVQQPKSVPGWTTNPKPPVMETPPDSGAARDEANRESTEEYEPPWWSRCFCLFQAAPRWLISMVLCAALLMLLALIPLPEQAATTRIVVVANPTEIDEVESLEVESFESEDIDPIDVVPFEGDENWGGWRVERNEKRGKDGLKMRRVSKGSAATVAAALDWLAMHQERDGGWDFDHTRGQCKGQCSHPGMVPPSRNAATAMALLPFLGAGQTHREGQYKETVERGLVYLIRSMKVANGMGDLSDAGGTLYAHGMASIALCEAYGMTNDPQLLQPAQCALSFIAFAQDPVGGGWRYEPKQAGDTSVLGWQLMALKSGHMADLEVPRRTIVGASKFLDSVQEADGWQYGYTVPGTAPTTTSVGLLCRMYLGWKHDESGLGAGVEYLHRTGPSDNMYYNYFATQVLHHYGGPFWDEWNGQLRDRLVEVQDTTRHEKGSWYFARDPWADKGGRLYCTSMATMILEVYYLHMPIYGKQAAEDDFPL